MKLSELGEFGLINRIRKLASRKPSSALVGIGDDAAVLKLSSPHCLLVTTDLLLEGIHFDLSFTDFYSLGWKSAAVNLSDIAAMGGVPRFCLSALGIPDGISVEQITDFYRGFNAVLKVHSASLVGGDTSASKKDLFISITAIGEAGRSEILTRAGARPGDRIFVTGTLGDSAAGLELLKAGRRRQAAGGRHLIQRHLRPIPRVSEGRKMALSGCVSAMIDISDGLSSDLSHICRQSGVGAEINKERIPLSEPLRQSRTLTKPVIHYALSGGEDYELLFTVPSAKLKKIKALGLDVTEIGITTSGKTVSLIDSGGKKPFLASGYDHFAEHQKRSARTRARFKE